MMILVASLGVTAVAACGGGGDDVVLVQAEATATTPPPTEVVAPALRGFSFPISGGCLPQGDQLMPNAPRTYRNGIHEGVDFYAVDNCAPIERGTAVIAVADGTIIRADLSYVNLTPAELVAYQAEPNTDAALDKFRGRQVWLDHGGGIVSRYAHLEAIAAGIAPGRSVLQGEVIASVGESGTPESVTNPGNQYHLHFELHVDASYLGAGLPPASVRPLYEELFGP